MTGSTVNYSNDLTINAGDWQEGIGITTTSSGTGGLFTIDSYGIKELVNVVVDSETITIFYKRAPTYSYTTWNGISSTTSPLPQAIKEIYGVKDGKLTLIKTVVGVVKPAYNVPEHMDFDE